MESEQIISQLQTHNLLDDPEIKKQFDDALQNENNQIQIALENSPFKDEDLALFERTITKTAKNIDQIATQINEDTSKFNYYNPNQKTDFIHKQLNEILAENEATDNIINNIKNNIKNNTNNKTINAPKSRQENLTILRNFALNKWQEILTAKNNKWKNDTQNAMHQDFLKRMQAWFDSLKKAKELSNKNDELFGKDGLFGDLMQMAKDSLDLQHLGDLKYQKSVLEDIQNITDIDINDDDNNKQNNFILGGKGIGIGNGNQKKINIATINHYFQMIKNNKVLMDICDILGKSKQEETETYKEKITELVSYSYTQTMPTKRYKEEISGVKLGNDLENLLPQEFALLNDPDLEIFFDLKFVENRLFCFEKHGYISYAQEKWREIEKEIEKERSKEVDEQKGPIIICVDTSGSMNGQPEIVAKALTLMLAARARKEKRACFLINFSSSVDTMDLSNSKGITLLNKFLEMSFGGGTDVCIALKEGLKQMEQNNYKKSDLIAISDGGFVMNNIEIQNKIKQKRKEENKFYLLDVDGNFGVKDLFDKHWVYNSNSKSLKVLYEMKKNV